ncbi:DUF1870 family protein [Halomonas sabkhae]|uniref:Aca2/YdiL-like domain-containing protein n=1 Tax=Halomonas sabkhae TaxID=626223 RepID=UPI0025B51954|nr:DUF1870 family protein [Halomonas sabkhae]MDN3525619.1 DUF1870 family protein [Halomonas sabkhae]
MTASELQALRKFLMLDVSEAAEIIGGVSRRSWQYWEAGRSPVPDDVEDKMNGALTLRQDVIDRLEQDIEDHGGDPQGEHGDRLKVPYYHTLASFQEDHPDQGALPWRVHQSAVAELYASNLVTLV